MEFDHVKDSGERQSFATGSVRDTQVGKGRYDLIPPISLKRLAQHYENGARKYGDRNWELGQPLSRYLNSALRHLQNILAGDTSEDHLAAAAWNVFAIIHTQEMCLKGHLPAALDDLPRPPATVVAKDCTVTFGGVLVGQNVDVTIQKMDQCDFKLATGCQCQLSKGHTENHSFPI